ncbi:MAG: hypothetical protein Q9162_002686 [Coniocarpon cinnabarinum]
MYQSRVLLSLASTLAIAVAQFDVSAPDPSLFTNQDQAISFLTDFATVESSYLASLTADPNFDAYVSAYPSEEASEISAALTADTDSPEFTSAALARATWPLTIPSLSPAISSWFSQATASQGCILSSLLQKYAGTVPPEVSVTCNPATDHDVNADANAPNSGSGASASGSGAAGAVTPGLAKWVAPVAAGSFDGDSQRSASGETDRSLAFNNASESVAYNGADQAAYSEDVQSILDSISYTTYTITSYKEQSITFPPFGEPYEPFTAVFPGRNVTMTVVEIVPTSEQKRDVQHATNAVHAGAKAGKTVSATLTEYITSKLKSPVSTSNAHPEDSWLKEIGLEEQCPDSWENECSDSSDCECDLYSVPQAMSTAAGGDRADVLRELLEMQGLMAGSKGVAVREVETTPTPTQPLLATSPDTKVASPSPTIMHSMDPGAVRTASPSISALWDAAMADFDPNIWEKCGQSGPPEWDLRNVDGEAFVECVQRAMSELVEDFREQYEQSPGTPVIRRQLEDPALISAAPTPPTRSDPAFIPYLNSLASFRSSWRSTLSEDQHFMTNLASAPRGLRLKFSTLMASPIAGSEWWDGVRHIETPAPVAVPWAQSAIKSFEKEFLWTGLESLNMTDGVMHHATGDDSGLLAMRERVSGSER